MQLIIYSSLLIYLSFYLFEGVIRFALNFVGADYFIFARDIILAVPLIIVFFQQVIQKKINPAFGIFFTIIILHGSISLLNIGSVFTVLYSIKVLMTMLAGAVFAPYLLSPPPWVLRVIFALWLITFFAVLADKYFVDYPWMGMETTIGDIQVEISRNWEVVGADKRAGGFMRSSINVAIIEPLLAFLLIFNLRAILPRLLVMAVTFATLFFTTQKGAFLAFFLTCGALLLPKNWQIPVLKLGVTLAIILLIVLPIILPQFIMPHGNSAKGVFSFESFYMRIEDVWPSAWQWIARHEVFPFGVGLGGIGGAQRFYAISSLNYADNMFILLYAYFGVMSLVYLGFLWWKIVRLPAIISDNVLCATSIILFLLVYGCVLSIIEDQMASLFLGAAIAIVFDKKYYARE